MVINKILLFNLGRGWIWLLGLILVIAILSCNWMYGESDSGGMLTEPTPVNKTTFIKAISPDYLLLSRDYQSEVVKVRNDGGNSIKIFLFGYSMGKITDSQEFLDKLKAFVILCNQNGITPVICFFQNNDGGGSIYLDKSYLSQFIDKVVNALKGTTYYGEAINEEETQAEKDFDRWAKAELSKRGVELVETYHDRACTTKYVSGSALQSNDTTQCAGKYYDVCMMAKNVKDGGGRGVEILKTWYNYDLSCFKAL